MSKKKKSSGVSKAKKWLEGPVLELLENGGNKTFNAKQIAHKLGISDTKTRSLIFELLVELAKKDKITEVGRGKFRWKAEGGEMEGVIEITKRGSAYILNPGGSDIFVAPGNLGNAMNNDLVKIRMYPGRRGGMVGKVIGIVERSKQFHVCTLTQGKNILFGIPDNRRTHVDFIVPEEELHGAVVGQKVLIEMTHWPDPRKSPFGKVTEILGNPGDLETEMQAVLAEQGLPLHFPEQVEKDAAKLTDELTQEDLNARRDFRDIYTFTIDPDDAKDFDDALSYRELEDGFCEIGVHIADVSHYVQPGTSLDDEAKKRATSVYLVDRVVPMLPEIISNGLCSLRPNETKRTFSAVFEINDSGVIRNQWFGRTLIHSDLRLTYGQAQDLIDSGEGAVGEMLQRFNKIAYALRKKRKKEGSVEFGGTEVKFEIDENGSPTAVIPKKLLDANRLIEDYMLLANRKVSAFVAQHPDIRSSFVYRIHDRPDPDKWRQFAMVCSELGYDMKANVSSKAIHEELNKVLHAAKGKPEEGLLQTMAIKSMAKAVYSTENVGHFGLAFNYYSHFTSPIRRYPDVMVHRILQEVLNGRSVTDSDALDKQCLHCSNMEKKAVTAERSSVKYMQVSFLSKHVGEVFDGIVSGVTSWGFFVEIIENKCEGLVAMDTLTDDKYYLDELGHKLVGQSSGKEIMLGDRVAIQVVKADLQLKQVDFELVDETV